MLNEEEDGHALGGGAGLMMMEDADETQAGVPGRTCFLASSPQVVAAGLQLEAPLNEHESRCTTAARVMQPKVTTKAEGAAAEGAAAAAAMAAGSARPPLLLVLWASSQLSGGVRPGPVVDFRRGEAAL